jgi:hypothetical protein
LLEEFRSFRNIAGLSASIGKTVQNFCEERFVLDRRSIEIASSLLVLGGRVVLPKRNVGLRIVRVRSWWRLRHQKGACHAENDYHDSRVVHCFARFPFIACNGPQLQVAEYAMLDLHSPELRADVNRSQARES